MHRDRRLTRSTLGRLAGVAVGVALIVPAIAWANTSGATTRAGHKAPPNVTVTLGTTDRIVSLDPAGSYDLPSWTIIYNVYQTLLKYIPGTTTIVSDAGSCAWQGMGATTYVCTMKPGQYFSNGDKVTAADVAYSFNRINTIKASTGPASLIAPMKSVTAMGDKVTFKLKSADATWPDVLTTGAGAIVDAKVYPSKSLQPSAAGSIIGSGPYYLASYTPNQYAVFKPNKYYGGNDVLHNSEFIVRYEETGTTLVSDLQSKAVDIAYRELSPTEIVALEHSKGITVLQGKGIEIRYIVFNLKVQPGKTAKQKTAIRQAVSYLINRADIAKNIYKATVKPLYSIIPDALPGHINSFENVYGSSPNLMKAKAVLKAAGVMTPVSFTLWYDGTDHYGDQDLATELQRQIDAGGLFKVSLNTAAWATYVAAGTTNQYGVSLFGWFPDYPDADDYTGPFYLCNAEWMVNHYCNMKVDSDIKQEEASTVQSVRDAAFGRLQTLTAEDAPLIPLWQGGQVAGVINGVTGVQSTLDASYTFRFWLIGKS